MRVSKTHHRPDHNPVIRGNTAMAIKQSSSSEPQKKWRTRTPEQKAQDAERARARRATPEGREKYRKIIKAFKQRQKQNNPDAWREQRYKEESERRAKQAERNGKKYNPRGQGNPTGFGVKYEYDVEKAYDRIIKRNAYDAFNWWFAKKSDADVMAWYEAMGKPWLNPRLSDAEQWKLKYRLCPEFTINERLRRQIKKVGTNDGIADLIRQALKRNGESSKVEILLGYSISDLRVHIERQFTKGMNWNKLMKGEIHIDHIIPKAVFDLSDYDQWRVCWDLPNLRPMWAKDNLKKRDKVLNLL